MVWSMVLRFLVATKSIILWYPALIIKKSIGSSMADTIAGCSLNTNTSLRLRVITTEPILLLTQPTPDSVHSLGKSDKRRDIEEDGEPLPP